MLSSFKNYLRELWGSRLPAEFEVKYEVIRECGRGTFGRGLQVREKFKDDDLVSEVLIKDEVTPAGSVGHPLTRERDLAFEDLIDEDWVLFGQSISDHAIHEQTFRVNGFEPPVSTVVCASFTCALALVENGNYVMLVPKQVFRGRVRGFPITPLRLTTPMQPWTIAVISRPFNLLAPACQEFVDELRKVAPLISIKS